MTTKTPSPQEDDIIIHVIALISILITVLISCFTPSPKKLPNLSATSPSQKKTSTNSTKPKSTTTERKANVQATAMSIATSEASSGATGSHGTPTKNSKAGTMSRPTRKSKSGRSTQSRSHRTTTK